MSILKLEDCNLHYQIKGKGPVLVFLHGLSDDLKFWSKLVELFENEYTVLTVDLRGHGKSTTKNGTINNKKFSQDIYQLLNHLNIKKATFIGFSLGGTVTLNYIIDYPEMVEKAVLMSTFGRISDDLKYVHKDIYKKLEKGLGEFYNAMIPLVLPEDLINDNPELIDKGYQNCLKKNQEAIKETIQAYYQLDIEDHLKNIKQPVLIIGGRDDKLLSPYKMMIRMFEEIEDSRILFLKDTKHNILIHRNIKKVYNLINSFLKE